MIDAMRPRPPRPRRSPSAARPGRGHAPRPAAADAAGPSDFRSEVTGIVPAVDGVHGRDPRRRRVPRAHRRRGPHGHRRGLHGRAVPAVPARRHRRAQPPVDRDLPQRRPPGRRSTIPRGRSPRPGPTPNPSGRRSPTAAPTRGTTTACTGWRSRRRRVDRGEPVGGRLRPVAGADRGRRRAGRDRRGPSSTRRRCRRSPTSALAVIVAGPARRSTAAAPGLRLAAALLAVVSRWRGRGRLGRLLVHPRRRRQPAALGPRRRRAGRPPSARSSSPTRRGRRGARARQRRPPCRAGRCSASRCCFKPVLPTELPVRARPHGRRPRPRRERRRRRASRSLGSGLSAPRARRRRRR